MLTLSLQNGSHLVAAGCDNVVTSYDMSTGQQQQIAQHDAPIKCCEFVTAKGQNVLATAGWDNKLKVSGEPQGPANITQYWDVRTSPNPIMTVDLGERAYSMDATKELMVSRGHGFAR